MIIAVDLMGGDNKVIVPVSGIKAFLKSTDLPVKFLAFGTKEAKESITNDIKSHVTFVESESYIKADENPIIAMRRGKHSSMFMAVEAVKKGHAHASVSAGNTGALMAISKLCHRTLESIERPAIATIVPTAKSFTLMLDMGANIECSSENLYQFAFMGQAFVSSVSDITNPTVGILNIGTEENKGTNVVKEAFAIFKERISNGSFLGFIEGDKIMTGDCNVIVTDGYSGNIALKTMEGAGRVISSELKKHIAGSMLGKVGYFLSKSAFLNFKESIDPNNYNGAMFLGLKGISVKSHGSANTKGFKNAIEVAVKLAKNDIISKIKQKINT